MHSTNPNANDEQQPHHYVRVLWPQGLLKNICNQNLEHALVGALIRAKHVHCGDMLIAVVLGVTKMEQSLQELHHKLQGMVINTNAPIDLSSANLAVLGTWSPTASDLAMPDSQVLGQCQLWLALHGQQHLRQAPKLRGLTGSSNKELLVPLCCMKQSKLPNGTSEVQIFLYDDPCEQHSSCIQQQVQHRVNVPWMISEPGTVTLAALMQFLQQAHHKLHQGQQQLLPQRLTTDNTHVRLHQPVTLQQQAVQDDWQKLAALLTWPNRSRQHSWPAGLQRRIAQHMRFLSCGPQQCQQPASAGNITSSDNHTVNSSSSSNDVLLPGTLQRLLGLVVCGLLVYYLREIIQYGSTAGGWLEQQVLQPHIEWLMQAHPGGIKLHQELSLLIGSAATLALDVAARLYTAAWPYLGPAAVLFIAAASALRGAAVGCRTAADAVLLVALPLLLVYGVAAALHKLQLRCLAATWRLIRGKEKVRRFSERWHQREQQQGAQTAAAPDPQAPPLATDEVSVEQLIVGVLLFTPLLGLLPTTVTWYISICCYHGAVVAVRLLVLVVSRLLCMQALLVLLSRFHEPQKFAGELMAQLLVDESSDNSICGSYEINRGHGMRRTKGMMEENEQGGSSSIRSTRLCAALAPVQRSAQVSHYHLHYKALSYAEVLRRFFAQHAVMNTQEKPNGSAVWLSLGAALVKGELWGVPLGSYTRMKQ